MKIIFTIVIVFLVGFYANGQKNKNESCEILQFAVNSNAFVKFFYKEKKDTMIIVDSQKQFINCSLIDPFGINITLISKEIEVNPNLHHSNNISKNETVIYRLEKKSNTWILYFWKPSDNGNIIMKIKKRKRKYVSTIISEGVF